MERPSKVRNAKRRAERNTARKVEYTSAERNKTKCPECGGRREGFGFRGEMGFGVGSEGVKQGFLRMREGCNFVICGQCENI